MASLATEAASGSSNGGAAEVEPEMSAPVNDPEATSSEDSGSETDSSGADSDSDDELTEEQKRAIAENIRKMQGNFAAYTEKQEKDKYQDLRHVIPDLTDEEAVLALEYCQGNELEAIEQLRSQPAFVDAVRQGVAARYRPRRASRPRRTPPEKTSKSPTSANSEKKQKYKRPEGGHMRSQMRDALAMAMAAGIIPSEAAVPESATTGPSSSSTEKAVPKTPPKSSPPRRSSRSPAKSEAKKASSSPKKKVAANIKSPPKSDTKKRKDTPVKSTPESTKKKKKKIVRTTKIPDDILALHPNLKSVKLEKGFFTNDHRLIGERGCRDFDGDVYEGVVVAWSPPVNDALFRFVMEDGDEEDLTLAETKAAMKLYQKRHAKKAAGGAGGAPLVIKTKTKGSGGSSDANASSSGGGRVNYSGQNMNNCLSTDGAKKLLELGWSDARVKAFMHRESNPNAYYYRFNDLGEEQHTGQWTQQEHDNFMDLIKDGVDYRWGILSIKVPGRVGYQCSNYYRLLIERGVIKDPNYEIVEKKNEKTGKMETKLKFTRPKNLTSQRLSVTGGYSDAFQPPRPKPPPKPKRVRAPPKPKPPKKKKVVKVVPRRKPVITGPELMIGFRDPMTHERVYDPAISPFGHVMSYDSWMQTLNNFALETDEDVERGFQRLKNVCPFTKQPLTRRQLVKLTQDNFEEYKDKIVNWDIRTDAAAESGEASGSAIIA